jgi:NAD(P)-dependent dehydrogenase (short-subunit alcohol dehydrogenase family)
MRTVLITGATAGIGKHAAMLFAKRGWHVWAGYRKTEDAVLLQALDPNVQPLHLDVTDRRSVDVAYDAIVGSGMRLDALINNAGVGLGGPLEILPIDEVRRVYEINVFGCMRVTQRFLPLLRTSRGRILNIGSLAGRLSMPFLTPYSSSKFAIEGLSDGLRRELRGQGVRVSLIEPGPLDTQIWQESFEKFDLIAETHRDTLRRYVSSPKVLERLFQRVRSQARPLASLDNALVHALESPRSKSRYLVAPGGNVLQLVLAILPDRVVDYCVDRYLA